MTSQLRSSFRAIPSSFVNKAAPTVPPASQTFEPLVKHAFTARQFNIFTNTAFGTWIVAAVWSSWQGAGTSSWVFSAIQPSTFALAIALWVTAALPSVVQRKIRLKDVRAVTTSPSAAVKRAFTSPGALRTALVYGFSAVAVLFIHLFMAAAIEPVDPKVGLFARSKYVAFLSYSSI
jgi:nucleoporin NDC1